MLTDGQKIVMETDLKYKRELLEEVKRRHAVDEKLIPEIEQGIEALEKRLTEDK